jgi:hypothetical protein
MTLSDKELQEKLQVIGNVVSLGFQIPTNLALSLTQIIVKMLMEIVDVKKDFLVKDLLELLIAVVLKVGTRPDYATHVAISTALHQLLKWSLSLIRDRTTAV